MEETKAALASGTARPVAARRGVGVLLAGQVAALLADNAFLVLLALLTAAVSPSAVTLGTVLMVAALPGAVLMPLGGVASDRFRPATMLALANLGRGLALGCLAGVVLAGLVQTWHLYVLAAALGVLDAFHYPAVLAAVPRVARPSRLQQLHALLQGAGQISAVAGPALATAAVATAGLGPAVAVTAMAFALAAGLFTVLDRTPGKATASPDGPREPARGPAGVARALREGARHSWRDRATRATLLLAAAITMAAIGPLLVGGTGLARERLGGEESVGLLLSAWGFGSLLGVLAAGSLGRRASRVWTIAGSVGIAGLGLAALGLTTTMTSAVTLSAVSGACIGYLTVVLIAAIQERTPDALQGRVMSLVTLASIGVQPASYAAAGLLAELGPATPFLAAGGMLIVTAPLVATSRAIRELDGDTGRTSRPG